MTRIYAYLAALVLLTAGAWGYGHTRYEAGKAKGDARVADIEARDAAELAAQSQAARTREAAQALITLDAERTLLQAYEHDKADQDRVIADIKSGNRKLRNEWAACSRLPKAGAATAQPDAGAEHRAADIAAVLRIAADYEAQIRALQAVLMGERQN